MPMRKHEMIYVFFENIPLYDISSHNCKLVKTKPYPGETNLYGTKLSPTGVKNSYDPPLPISLLQFRSEHGKHKTQKPTTMMEWVLRYYSK